MTKRSTPVLIGIPAFNAGAYLEDCLASLAAQTYPDFEATISDNASTDGTLEIARAFAARDHRFRVLTSDRNVGAARNFNRVVPRGRGTYFKWLAADDRVAPDFLERTVAVLDADPSAVLVAPHVRLVDQSGAPLPYDAATNAFVAPHGERKAPPVVPRGLRSRSPAARFRSVVLELRDSVLAAHTFGLLRLDALRATPLIGSYPGAEKVMLAQLSLMGRFEEVCAELYDWRIHPDHTGGLDPAGAMRQLDPTWNGRFTFMGARQINGYVHAALAVPITPWTRARCLAVVVAKVPMGIANQLNARRASPVPRRGRSSRRTDPTRR